MNDNFDLRVFRFPIATSSSSGGVELITFCGIVLVNGPKKKKKIFIMQGKSNCPLELKRRHLIDPLTPRMISHSCWNQIKLAS